MSNIFVNLPLPINAVIRLDMKVPRDKVARKLEEERMVAEVRRAIQAWYYEN